MNYLVDINVISEIMRNIPEPNVVSWLDRNEPNCFMSSVSIGEIERGLELLPSGRRKLRLQEGFREFFFVIEDRILAFDTKVARQWAKLTSASQRKGRKSPVLDSMIEATALHWNLTIVTRNTSDFIQARTLNPWSIRS